MDLVRAHPWERATFTTYALSLSFVEAVLLDALVRGRGRDLVVLADVEGVRAALSEQGARRTGRDYEIEPVAVARGVFHPKVGVLSGGDEHHLLVGSGNVTFNGWGGNLEVIEHLHPSFAADAFDDAADFFEQLALSEHLRHGAADRCELVANDMRRAASGGQRRGDIRLLHSLSEGIADRLAAYAADLGGARRLVAAAPFWDGGAAIDGLCEQLGLDEVFVHAHPGGAVEGTVGRNWPAATAAAVHAVRLAHLEEEEPRRLHAKIFEVICARGRIVVSGSANATRAALAGRLNVEACVARIQRERTVGWSFEASAPLEPGLAAAEAETLDAERLGILRAVLKGDEIAGQVLTPRMAGVGRAFQLASGERHDLGEVQLDDQGAFQLFAPGLETQSWRGGRLVLRIELGADAAEGFVSVAGYSEVARRAGAMAPRLMAMLAGSEAPADVAAIMSWLYEDPNRLNLAGMAPTGGGGGAAADRLNQMIPIDELNAAFVQAPASNPAGPAGPSAPAWTRFMAQLLAALREPRGPFAEPEDSSDDDREGGGVIKPADTEPDPDIARSLARFERVFDLFLEPHNAERLAMMAFDLTLYVCDRLEPDASLARRWTKKLANTFTTHRPPPGRLDDVAKAVLLLLAGDDDEDAEQNARTRLLRMGYDLSGPAPASDLPQLRARLNATETDEELWGRVQAVRTLYEAVQSYIVSLRAGQPSDDYIALKDAFPDVWPTLADAFTSPRAHKQVLIHPTGTDRCPKCHRALPSAEANSLKQTGLAVARNCCGRIILREGL